MGGLVYWMLVSVNTGVVTPIRPATLKEPFPPWQVCVTIQQSEIAKLLIRAPTYLGNMPILPTLTSTKPCLGVPSIRLGQHTGKQNKTVVRVLVHIPIKSPLKACIVEESPSGLLTMMVKLCMTKWAMEDMLEHKLIGRVEDTTHMSHHPTSASPTHSSPAGTEQSAPDHPA